MPQKPKAATPRKKPGLSGRKPSVRYSVKLAAEICEQLATGEPWSEVCKGAGMPSYGALYTWAEAHPAFAKAVKAARRRGAEHAADEALLVARQTSATSASADRLKVSHLQWRATRYGEAGEPERPQVEIVLRVKRYEKVRREDGSYVLREILPEGRR